MPQAAQQLLLQVTWSPEVARWAHGLPLLAAAATAVAAGLPLWQLAKGVGRVAAGAALCVALPAATGILRVALLGGACPLHLPLLPEVREAALHCLR